MAKLEVKTKENPKLHQRVLSDGRISLYLEYYLGRMQWIDEETGAVKIKHDRKKESLGLYLTAKPKNHLEKEENRKIIELAQQIRYEREQELKEDRTGKRIFQSKDINFLDYFQSYIDNYTKKDIRMVEAALRRFTEFLELEYPLYRHSLKPEQINKEMVEKYVQYLLSQSKGEGGHSIYSRFKKVVLYAVDNNVIPKNPCKGVICKVDENTLRKDILSEDEMIKLIEWVHPKQNMEIRNAFIFSLYTGMRFCDIQRLQYKHIDYAHEHMRYEQVKTTGKSSSSGVDVPLSKELLAIIGEAPKGKKEDLVFDLPSYTMCIKSVQRWVKNAGIDKHITWHCARHSLAVNLLNNGANIKTVASVLGHSGLKHTEKYTRAVDSLKKEAIDSLPKLKL